MRSAETRNIPFQWYELSVLGYYGKPKGFYYEYILSYREYPVYY